MVRGELVPHVSNFGSLDGGSLACFFCYKNWPSRVSRFSGPSSPPITLLRFKQTKPPVLGTIISYRGKCLCSEMTFIQGLRMGHKDPQKLLWQVSKALKSAKLCCLHITLNIKTTGNFAGLLNHILINPEVTMALTSQRRSKNCQTFHWTAQYVSRPLNQWAST